MFRAAFLPSILALVVIAATTSLAAAAVTAEQRKAAEAIKVDLDKAGRLFQQGKIKEAGDIIRDVQTRIDKFASTADTTSIKLLDPIMSRLKKAHPLLELEGIELEPLTDPVAGSAAAEKPGIPDKGKPEIKPVGAGGISFVKDVAPLIVARCGGCHVSDAKGMFSMADYAALMKGNKDGKVVFPGNPDGSRIIEVIESGDMPRGGGKVGPAEFLVLKKWIMEGAKFDGKEETANLAALAPDAKADAPVMVGVAAATGKETISFAKDVAPVLADTCFNCHGGGQQTRANFNLVTFTNLLKGGDSGAPVTPGKGADSLLIKKLKGTAEGNRMPQNLPALPDAVIAKIEKWIDEGAKYDGGDPNLGVKQVAALAKANGSTHEELMAERKTLAETKWKLGLPGVQAKQIETKNFLVMGNVQDQLLQEVSAAAEAVLPRVATMLKAPTDKPLIKGRMTLYVMAERYDYAEFSNMVERRELPKNLRGHFIASPVEVYGAIIPGKPEEYNLEALVAQQIAGGYAANLGKGTPRWFSEGIARAVAGKIAPTDPRIDAWDADLPRVLGTMNRSDDAIEGKLNPEDGDVANYSFVRFLMSDRKFDTLMTAMKKGQDFTPAFSATYGLSPSQLSVTWASKGAIVKRPKK